MKFLITSILLVVSFALFGQEFKARVAVTFSEVQNPDKDMFEKMRQNLQEFVENRNWTKHVFDENERIEISYNFRIISQSSDYFTGSLQIQASRPVYGATYTSPLINFLDEQVSFEYKEFEALDFDENTHISNLTSIIAFYAYVVLGLDYDTFQQSGGTEFYQKAQNIVNNAQSAPEQGWKSQGDKNNRYWLVENILDGSYSSFRNCLYIYHRLGLDVMSSKVKDGRAKVEEGIMELEKVYKVKPGAFLLDFFFYAKKSEVKNIFSEAMPDEQKRIVTVLKKINPSNASDYDQITKK